MFGDIRILLFYPQLLDKFIENIDKIIRRQSFVLFLFIPYHTNFLSVVRVG